MKAVKRHIIFSLVILFITLGACSQQTGYTLDSLYASPIITSGLSFHLPVFSDRESILERNPEKEDSAILAANAKLITAVPDAENYINYAETAAALWKFKRNKAAKKMFALIQSSRALFYTQTEFHSSGTRYEYGSFTSNYKNEACLYLCKIYIEEKDYKKALAYLVKADKEYQVHFNCGTGENWYRQYLNSLYAICYTSLGMTDKVIALYLDENFYSDEVFVNLVRNHYSPAEIKRYIRLALDNIMIVKDVYPTQVFTTVGKEEKDSLIATYINGTASTILFGRKVTLPRPDLQNGETITRDRSITEFKNSLFYTSLLNIKKDLSYN